MIRPGTAAAVIVVAVACVAGAPARAPQVACRAAVEAQAWRDAADHCAQAFAAGAGDHTGQLLALAYLELEERDRAVAVAARLDDRLYAHYVLARAESERDPARALLHASLLIGDATLAAQFAWIAQGAFFQAGAAKALGKYALAEQALALVAAHGGDLFSSQLGKVNLLRAAGDFDEARRLGQDAVAIARTLGPRAEEAYSDAVAQLALVHLEAGDYGPAAFELHRVAQVATIPELLGAAAINRAYIADKLGRCPEAIAYLYLAHVIEHDTFDWLLLAGQIELDCGDLAVAERRLLAAQALPHDGSRRWQVLDVLGDYAERTGDPARAERHYRAAIAEVEELRRNGGRLEAIVAGKLVEPYEHAIELVAQRGDWRAALALVLRHEQGADRPDAVDATIAAWRGRALAIVVRGRARVWRIDLRDGQLGGADLGPVPRLGGLDLLDGDPRAIAIADQLGAALAAGTGPLHVDLIGDLALVPLAALRHGGDRLIAQRALVRVVRVAPDPQPRATGTAQIVLGDPTTAAEAGAGSGPGPGLPGARSEATWVADRLGVVPRLGPDATRRALIDATDAALLHVASHAAWTLDGPLLPLADGTVTAADLILIAPAPRLVVLASCFSARARDRGGWTSLAAGFLDAGATMVISTQTSVDDQAARRLVEAFYRHGGVTDPAEALRQAQLELAAAGIDPHEWASFVAIAAPPPPPSPPSPPPSP